MILSLAACAPGRDDSRVALAPPPPALMPTDQDSLADRTPSTIQKIGAGDKISLENQALALSADPPVPQGCGIKDRFDRSALWSLASKDGQKKLALDVDTSGTKIEGAMLRYSFKFQPGKNTKKKEHCLYPSQVQGLAPSAYRELVKRKSNTVWQHLKGLKADIVE